MDHLCLRVAINVPPLGFVDEAYGGHIDCWLQSMQYIPMITNQTIHWWVPNVVVAHLKEGIEAVHLATGRTVCKVIDLVLWVLKQEFLST